MSPAPPPADAAARHPLGTLLREWRARRGRSQLALALDMGVSQRHLSFIESGRSAPSRAMLHAIAQSLDVPFRDRNALLLAAGFAPSYAEPAWDATEMRAVNRALQRLVRQHEPFPAVVMDRHWNVLMTNAAAPRFFGLFIDMSRRQGPRNLLRLMFDADGMRPFIADRERVARGLLERMQREAVDGLLDERTRQLMADLRAGLGPEAGALPPGPASGAAASPVIPIGFRRDGLVLNYFSLVATVGTPLTITAQELRVECMFPADDATEAWHLAHCGTPPPTAAG